METFGHALHEAAKFIKAYDHFLVISHIYPDGDATGSALAMAHLLRKLNKSYTIVNEGASPKRFSFLNGYDHIINLKERPLTQTFDYVIAVDVADEGRMGEIQHLFSNQVRLLNIDHHPTNTRFGHINVVCPQAASTTEIIYHLCQTCFPNVMHDHLAEALYTGLLTDTGGFRYANTTKNVLETAAHLLEFGLNPAEIARHSLETVTSAHVELLKRALNSLTFAYENQVAMMIVNETDLKESQAAPDDQDGLASFPVKIEGVEVGVVFKELKEGEVKVSLRSKARVNVAELAKCFGGGGHARAAGFTYLGSLEEAKANLLAELKPLLN
jgi:phosphoesterase RecJ-like protein